ncbi:MAG: hypothetical protein F4X20_00580 [Dehalococcoidia bacterium]|nr:hypothetical protein [Dehalococcoidia bacterium]
MESRPAGQIFDIGYQRYDGPRQGRNRARIALFTAGVRQTLGLGRGGRAKVLPVLLLLTSVVPAAIILTIAVLTGSLLGVESRPVELGDYFPITALLMLILAGIMAPNLLIPDRRDNVLSLYLVRPAVIADYLAARWLAFFVVTTIIVALGPLLLLTGYVLLSGNAWQELQGTWREYFGVMLGAAAIGAFLTAVPLGIAAFTPRRAYAAAVVIGGALVISAAIGFLTEPIDFGGSTTTTTRPITEEELAVADQFVDATRSLPGEAETRFTVELESGEARQYLMSPDEVEQALQGGSVTTFESTEFGSGPEPILDPDIGQWVVFADPTGATVFITDLLFEDVQSNTYRQLVSRHPDYYAIIAYAAWILLPVFFMWARYRRYTT